MHMCTSVGHPAHWSKYVPINIESVGEIFCQGHKQTEHAGPGAVKGPTPLHSSKYIRGTWLQIVAYAFGDDGSPLIQLRQIGQRSA